MPKTQSNQSIRRLTKSEIKDFLENKGAILHEEYTKFFFEDYGTGYTKNDLVYELPNGDFLYVFDPKGIVLPGKGDYYEKESFLRTVRWTQKVNDDVKHRRASSVENWKFYSKQGSHLFLKTDENLQALNKELNINKAELDFSYTSLAKIDSAVDKLPYGKAWEELYDELVYYVGEVIIKRVDGMWAIETLPHRFDYPFVTVAKTNIRYMPINIVYKEIEGLNPCNLRKATADEVRTNAIWHPKNNK